MLVLSNCYIEDTRVLSTCAELCSKSYAELDFVHTDTGDIEI